VDNFYPVVDGLLEQWLSHARLPYEGVRVVGTMLSSASHAVKDLLARNSVPY
jgi:thioredoxin reductase (NADPH)